MDLMPQDPSARRVIMILDSHDIEKCEIAGESHTLYDRETCVIPFPVLPEGSLPAAIQNIRDANLLRPGTVVVQNPYDLDSYETPDDAPEQFPLRKYMLFSVFCQALGARSVDIEQIDLSTQNGKMSFTAEGKRLGISGNLSINADSFEKVRSNLTLNDSFDGGPADLAAAEGLLRRTKMLNDPIMVGLLEARKLSGNSLKSKTVQVNISKETKSNLSIVAGLKIPKIISLKTDYSKIMEKFVEYNLKINIKF